VGHARARDVEGGRGRYGSYRSETDVLDRFFEDECMFGPERRVPKKDLFDAWARWCDAEGIDAGTQATFTRTVKERGITRGFSEKKVMGTRVWVGISLDIPPSDPPSAPRQNPSKQGGITEEQGHFPSNSENFSPEGSREEESGENDEKCPSVPLDEIYPPADLDVDGVETEYGILEEE
jgi:phage/plasmid-associated DNA primase